MFLYLLRHANADTIAANDDDRPLSDKGRAQGQQVADFCKARDLKPALILTSPANRRWATGFTSAPGIAFSPDDLGGGG